jgi:hypothetical protein
VARFDPAKLKECLKEFQTTDGDFTGTREGGGFTGVHNGKKFSVNFNLSLNSKGIGREIRRRGGQAAGDEVGLAIPGNPNVYIASDFASNPNVVDIAVTATEFHELGNYLGRSFFNARNRPKAKSKFLRNRDPDAGMRLEECVFGGGVASNTGQVTTNP